MIVTRTTTNRLARWLACRTATGRARLRALDAATLWPAWLNSNQSAQHAATIALMYAQHDTAWQRPNEWAGKHESPAVYFMEAHLHQQQLAAVRAAEENMRAQRAALAEKDNEERLRKMRGRPPHE